VTFGVAVDDLVDVADALRRHRLVVVRGRRLDVDEQVRFTATLGCVVGSAPGQPQVRYEDDRVAPAGSAFFNEQWHADLSWCAQGPVRTVLYAIDVGREAPATAFVDTVTGFERLPDDARAEVASWRARHHVEHSRQLRYGRGEVASAPRRWALRRYPRPRPIETATVPTEVDRPGPAHPVVVTDPGSGRKGVLLGDHAWTLEGFPDAEGRRRVEEVQAGVVALGDRYVHGWRKDDLVVFDNRTVLHRREPSADPAATRRPVRRLRRTAAWPRIEGAQSG
jgi:taurine dioxygenase